MDSPTRRTLVLLRREGYGLPKWYLASATCGWKRIVRSRLEADDA